MIHTKPKFLYLLASVFWLIAGINVIRIGIDLIGSSESRLFMFITLTFIVFIFFFRFIFDRTVKKNIRRINSLNEEVIPFWKFMDAKGYFIMVFMIILGVCIRYFRLLPDFFISFFYIGLGLALIMTAFKYLPYYFKKS
ncbi:MAG: hypothetical protein ACRDD8_00630 [Bacteroidales bacterium]